MLMARSLGVGVVCYSALLWTSLTNTAMPGVRLGRLSKGMHSGWGNMNLGLKAVQAGRTEIRVVSM